MDVLSLYGCFIPIWMCCPYVDICQNCRVRVISVSLSQEQAGEQLSKINCLVTSKVRIKQQATDSKH